ncbi:ThuA domain-containing protein [Echinimonas agarilytica]|uniref:ThuA domain-containing protein n=1 Tax=Echinimonas agarilytica TaxID=1215918 RepID=A0AA41W7J6_9GAMM|nr:ThuA domain-containing protein [Echinimonas agarilytica]MCM2679986.1 ThuA domain-containing protein [Echinimonas agarilytica]
MLSPNLNYVLSVDESTYTPGSDWGDQQGRGMGDFHPIAWHQEFDGALVLYPIGTCAGSLSTFSFS